MGWTTHVTPFHASATAAGLEVGEVVMPTAVQAVAVGHDTASRRVSAAPVGFGVAWIAQLLPSQRSAKVSSADALGEYHHPAAVQLAAEHDTPFRRLPLAPGGFGVDWIAQLVPSQCSASVTLGLPLVKYDPAAVHEDADGHDTPAGRSAGHRPGSVWAGSTSGCRSTAPPVLRCPRGCC